MMRYFKATVEYDGTDFAGFQWQHGFRTVQGVLEAAIAERMESPTRLTGAGRTDAGVHGLGQVVSFGAETRIPIERVALALNAALPPDLKVRVVEEVDERFSARFSASSRVYGYLILNRPVPSALWQRYSAFVSNPLDVEAMQTAAANLLGERDFASFANELRPGEVTMRDLMRCSVGKTRQFVFVRVEANAFLRGMVRTIVGTLLNIGAGKTNPAAVTAILEAKDRRQAGASAPAQGLCLLRVRYGERKHYGRQWGQTEE